VDGGDKEAQICLVVNGERRLKRVLFVIAVPFFWFSVWKFSGLFLG